MVKSWIRVILCFGIAFMLTSLLISGELSLYINPSLKWLVGISVILLVILGIAQLWQLKGHEMHRVGLIGYCLAFLPLLLFLVVPPKSLDASMAAKKGVNMIQEKAASLQQQEQDPNQTASFGADLGPDPYQVAVNELKKVPVIKFNEQNFTDYINALNLYPDQLVGKKVEVYGFVYRDNTMKKNQFVIARYDITCCTADASIVGFLVNTTGDVPPINKWIKITGKLNTEEISGYPSPVLSISNYQAIEAPKDPYIY